jgi:hypothetical protein
MGIKLMFKDDKADFKRMTSVQGVYVSDVFQVSNKIKFDSFTKCIISKTKV